VFVVDGCFIVPDDWAWNNGLLEKVKELQEEWRAETWKPKMRGSKLTRKAYPTITFADWMGTKFTRVEFIEYEI